MRKGWLGRLGVAAATSWLALNGAATMGCAGEQTPINQVQDSYIKKSDLMGPDKNKPAEWYIRNTVIETRRTNPFVFPGEQDELKRVRWDIQENFLIARRSYEIVSGSDGKGAKPEVNDGIIVAMYPITSHFDVRRAYNSATGEEQNIIVENSSDRPWWDREYMRVDWSMNLATDPDLGGIWYPSVFGELHLRSVAYYETDPNSPNRPVFDTGNGYMDITSKWLMAPESWTFSWGTLPVCLILNIYSGADVIGGTNDCNDQEVAIRTSFLKVPDKDYEIGETNNAKWAMFGTFNRDRYGYDRQYQVTDSNWHRLMARHNVWMESHDHAKSCFKDGDKAKADAACSAVPGSVCDYHRAECTIPYEQRKVRTIPYYVDAAMPVDLDSANVALIGEWNEAIMNGIGYAREAECRKIGGDAASCHSKWFDGEKAKAENGPALVLCHNPVSDKDDKACGPIGTRARQGDLRYNLIGWINQPLVSAPLGYGPDGADPLTGEVVQATAYVYGAALDSYAAMTRDLVALANGDLKPEDFANGAMLNANLGTYTPIKPNSPSTAPISEAQRAAFASFGDYMAGKNPAKGNGMTDAEIKARMGGLDLRDFVTSLGAAAAVSDGGAASRLKMVNDLIAKKGVDGAPGFGGAAEADNHANSLATKAAGTDIEKAFVDDKDYLLGAAFNDQMSDVQMKAATSPFGGLSMMQVQGIREKMRSDLENRGICHFSVDEFNAPHIEGLAKRLKDKYKDLDPAERAKKVFEELRWTIYKAVTEHEVGHTVALRHNFQGSWDSVNFHPNYWNLRTKGGSATAACASARVGTAPDTCMGPRYLDPESKEELGTDAANHAGIEEFAYSSIMDYGYDFNTDLHGLGSYDKAAMKFIYGGVVETFAAGNAASKQVAPVLSTPITEQWMVKRNDPKIPGGEQVQPTHYTELYRVLAKGGVNLYDPARCHPAAAGTPEEDDAINGQVCDAPVKDHAFVDDMVSGDLTEVGAKDTAAMYWKHKTSGAIRWPYRFGTDEYARYPHILRFDAGADVYEGATNVAKLYEYRYLLDFWRRGRRGWVPYFMTSRLWDRYFSRFQKLGWLSTSKTAIYSAMYPKETVATNPALNSDDWGRGYGLALSVMFETVTHSVLRPQPEGYGAKADQPGQINPMFEVPDFGSATTFKVGITDGRYVDEVFDNDIGGSFHYLSFMQRMGTYIEKPIASFALTWPAPPVHTFSRDTYTDGRNMLLNFRTAMPRAYDRLYAGILAMDWDTIAPYVISTVKDSAGNTPVNYTKIWEPDVKRPAGAKLVDPLVGYKTQVPTLLYGMWHGSYDGSMGFTNSVRVWIEGGVEGITVPDAEKIVLYEPESGVTWAAHKMGTEQIDGKTVEVGIGARMLTTANFLLAAAYEVQTGSDGMPLYVGGKVQWKAGKTGVVISEEALTAFRRYVGFLNVERQAMHYWGI